MGGRIIRSFCLLQRGWIARANKVERNGAIILIGGPVVIMNQPRLVEMVHILYVMHPAGRTSGRQKDVSAKKSEVQWAGRQDC